MDIEFHYYMTYALARKGGFSSGDAYKIAYASQYTDDNDDIYEVEQQDGTIYRNYISQTLNICHPKNKLVRIYSCFHFLPGNYEAEKARREDGALHLFNTTPDHAPARQLFEDALKSNNMYRIGVASHAYADTWAHQNYVGFQHPFGNGEGLLAKILPSIGHADYMHRPDIPNLIWDDPRLLGKNQVVNNKKRFLDAAKKMFRGYANHNNVENIAERWGEMKGELEEAIGKCCSDVDECRKEQSRRLKAYKKIYPEVPEYEKTEWQEGALIPKGKGVLSVCDDVWQFFRKGSEVRWRAIAKPASLVEVYWPKRCRIYKFRARGKLQKSHWYRFQEAVKTHQNNAINLLQNRYEQVGAAVRNVW